MSHDAPRTHVLLDGLYDTDHARQLSARWMAAGLVNAVDPAGQSAWLVLAENRAQSTTPPPGEKPCPLPAAPCPRPHPIDTAASIARAFGVELRDRVGVAFVPANDLSLLREKLVHEYKSRFATALVFVLPALTLHYLGPVLAGSGGQGIDAKRMVYPWLFELLLVGWAVVAAGWPMLWQAAVALVHLRATSDLLTAALVALAYAPSAFGVLSMLWRSEPWFAAHGGPMFHAAGLAVTVAALARWLAHRRDAQRAGRADVMIPRWSRWVGVWLIAALFVAWTMGWSWGVALLLALPPSLPVLAVNAVSPGVSVALPVVSFAVLLLLGERALGLDMAGMQVEVAALFGVMFVVVMGAVRVR